MTDIIKVLEEAIETITECTSKLENPDIPEQSVKTILDLDALKQQMESDSTLANFTPADDYDSLRRQTYSLLMIAQSKQYAASVWQEKAKSSSKEYVQGLKDLIESERAMNAQLTEELQRMESAKPVGYTYQTQLAMLAKTGGCHMSQSPKSETSIALYLHPAPFKELTDEELGNVLFRVRLNDTMTAGEAHLRIAKTIQEAVMEKNQ